ncbi:hypothetical protein PPTG_21729, partial [Phytophthora nicotianae INRA-310]
RGHVRVDLVPVFSLEDALLFGSEAQLLFDLTIKAMRKSSTVLNAIAECA